MVKDKNKKNLNEQPNSEENKENIDKAQEKHPRVMTWDSADCWDDEDLVWG